MQLHRFAPSEPLAPFVRVFEVLETDAPMLRSLVPEPGLILAFRYAGSASLVESGVAHRVPDQALTGVRRTARRMFTPAGGGLVLAKFRGAGAGAFFDLPLHHLFGETVDLAALADPGAIRATADRLGAARDHQARVAAVEAFLLALRTRRAWPGDPLVDAALRSLKTDPAALRVGALARQLGLSVDSLEKRFRRVAGASPKQLAAILRLRRAIAAHRPGLSLTRLAQDAGYYDQPHFIRQVVAAVGEPPKAFLEGAEYCL